MRPTAHCLGFEVSKRRGSSESRLVFCFGGGRASGEPQLGPRLVRHPHLSPLERPREWRVHRAQVSPHPSPRGAPRPRRAPLPERGPALRLGPAASAATEVQVPPPYRLRLPARRSPHQAFKAPLPPHTRPPHRPAKCRPPSPSLRRSVGSWQVTPWPSGQSLQCRAKGRKGDASAPQGRAFFSAPLPSTFQNLKASRVLNPAKSDFHSPASGALSLPSVPQFLFSQGVTHHFST